MSAGVRAFANGAPRSAPFNAPFAVVKNRTPSHWLALMSLLVLVTAIALLMSETHFLAGDPVANAFRFSAMALLGVMLAFRPRDRAPLRRPRLLDGFALMFSGLALASFLYSADPSVTILRATSAILLYVAVFWTLWFYADVVGGRKVADILLLAVALIFVAGVASMFVTDDAWLSGRYRGVLANPNGVGMLTILFMPLIVVRAMRTRRLSDYFLIALMLGSVVLSGSRNGVITTSVSLTFLAFRLKAWKAGVFLAAVAAAIYLAMPDYTPSPGMAAKPITHLLSNEKLANGGGRVEAWQVAIPIIQDKILLGHGFGTEDLIFKGMKFLVHRGEYIHNSYLGLTYQLGLAGSSLIFLPLFGLLTYRLMGHGHRSRQTAAYETLLFGGLIAAFFESWIYSAGNAFAFPFWTCVMLLTRASMGIVDADDLPPRPRAMATVRRFTPVRSVSPDNGPVNGLVPVLAKPSPESRPNPRRFDPPESKA